MQLADDLMASLGGRVNSIDAGIKNAAKVRLPLSKGSGGRACTAIHTVTNEHKQPIGQYCCSNSTWELSQGLMEMRLRFEHLDPEDRPHDKRLYYGQLWYCDDPKLYGNPIRVAFNGRVGVGLRPGDDGIKQDLYHGAERFDGILQSGHSLKTQVKSLFYEAFLMDEQSDYEQWIKAGSPGEKRQHVRQYIPSPELLLPRFDSLVAR